MEPQEVFVILEGSASFSFVDGASYDGQRAVRIAIYNSCLEPLDNLVLLQRSLIILYMS